MSSSIKGYEDGLSAMARMVFDKLNTTYADNEFNTNKLIDIVE